jgi:hypothetical protein
MKYLQMCLVFFLIILSQISCSKVHQSGTALQKKSDSLALALKDSLVRSDPWLRYKYTERQGKQLFEQYCVVCHGQVGEGDGFNAYNLNPKPHSLADSTYMKALSIDILTETIAIGGKGVNKSVLMPAYQNTLDKIQISNVVGYIVTFTKTKTGP